MKEKTIDIIALVFTWEGRRVGRGTVVAETGETFGQALSRDVLQMGSFRPTEEASTLPMGRACPAVLEGRGEYWVTLSPGRFLLREVPAVEEQPLKKLL